MFIFYVNEDTQPASALKVLPSCYMEFLNIKSRMFLPPKNIALDKVEPKVGIGEPFRFVVPLKHVTEPVSSDIFRLLLLLQESTPNTTAPKDLGKQSGSSW